MSEQKGFNDWKQLFEKRRQRCIELHRRGAGGIRVSSLLAESADEVLHRVFSQLPHEQGESLAIIATGGYGRREINFGSDIDVVFLVDDIDGKHRVADGAKQVLHNLLTLGISIGHSFRTVEECIRIAKKVDEPAMSLLEGRFVCGNALVFGHFQKQMRLYVQSQSPKAMVRRIARAREARLRKYGYASQLLEPNVKNSAGGLRDIHSALWLMYALGFCEILTPRRKNALEELFATPAVIQLFPKSMVQEVRTSYDFILRMRNEMHLQAGSLHDTLDFSFQQSVANALHRNSKGKKSIVETVMQEYYTAARSIEHFTERLFRWAFEEWVEEKKTSRVFILDDTYYVQSDTLYSKTKKLTPSTILQGAWYLCKYGVRFSFQLEDTLSRLAPSIRPTYSDEETTLLHQIFNNPNGVSTTLRVLSTLGLLERWIPEWKKVRAFYQHSQYHVYTVDEHTLRVIQYAEEVQNEQSPVGSVCRELPRKDILIFACLFHDIAKPLNLSKHDGVGSTIAKRVLHRLGFHDIVDDVAFLVRHHLAMEQVAFRRNIDDPQTIASFAALVGTIDKLKYLYVLTSADLSAVNPSVLTNWKKGLLETLYAQTVQYLEERWSLEQLQEFKRKERHATKQVILRKLAKEFSREVVEYHLSSVQSPEYVKAFTADEITVHIKTLEHLESIQVTWLQKEHWTEITFFANDAPGLLSSLCAILAINDANILDAQIFTRTDGRVIDKFRVIDFTTRTILTEEVLHRILTDTQSLFKHSLNVDERLEVCKQRWKRHLQRSKTVVHKVDVQFSEHPRYTIVDVYGPDTIGFLYTVTRTLATLGCTIQFAKIATRLDGVVDTFYILDDHGEKVFSEERKMRIRERILEDLRIHNESLQLNVTP
ncbi:MAG: HD domain-containing protein [Bacteroidetes bacterium]|nr:HD domain-containing protein [Bacteroidota bacterium]